MPKTISKTLRHLVAVRADFLCEYCLLHEDDMLWGCEVDHIISLKHDGPTEPENLAYACAFCNRQKGSDVGSISKRSGEFIRFFNPRHDRWAAHFRVNGVVIEALTDIGEATTRILGFNASDQLLERRTLAMVGRYPTEGAWARINA